MLENFTDDGRIADDRDEAQGVSAVGTGHRVDLVGFVNQAGLVRPGLAVCRGLVQVQGGGGIGSSELAVGLESCTSHNSEPGVGTCRGCAPVGASATGQRAGADNFAGSEIERTQYARKGPPQGCGGSKLRFRVAWSLER